jgi:Mn2+/Fe2+ NRAMP family transporter
MSDTAIIYPPLADDLKQGLNWHSAKYFGAGAIMASVTISSGETVFASRAGALFGYSLLWCFVAGALMKGVQVYVAARHMVLTGDHPMTHWAYLPGPKNWVPITIGLLSLVCFPFWQSALPLMLGNIVNWIFGIQGDDTRLLYCSRLWATLAIVVAVTLVWLESYAFLERAQVLIVGTLVGSLFAAAVACRPDWLAALVGSVVPTVPDFEPWVAERYPSIAGRSPWVEVLTYVGAIGGGTYDYLGYIGFLREKAWGAVGRHGSKYAIAAEIRSFPLAVDTSAANVRRGKRWLLPTQIDIGVGFFCVLLFTVCFVLLSARILRPDHLVPAGNDLFNHQARFLTELHPALLYVYQLGIFMTFFGTIYGAYEVYVRTAFESLMPISARLRRIPFERFRRGIVLYCATLGLVFLWTMTDPVKLVTPAALVGGVFSCGLWCLAMLWADRRFLPAPLRMGPVLCILTAISGVVLTLLGSKALWDYAVGLLGSS